MKITEKSRKKLLEAIPLITAYVAFADGDLDKKEIESARNVAGLRRFASKVEPQVRKFYKDVFDQFDDTFLKLLHDLPVEEGARNEYLEREIAKMNPILKEMDPLHGLQLLKSFKSFAAHVAKAEGGFLSMGSYGPKEAEAIKLKMLTDIDSL